MSAGPGLPADADGPVTTTVTRRAKPGHEVLYEQFLEGIIAAASRFPGHLGAEVLRPQTAAAPPSMPPGWSAPNRTCSARCNARS